MLFFVLRHERNTLPRLLSTLTFQYSQDCKQWNRKKIWKNGKGSDSCGSHSIQLTTPLFGFQKSKTLLQLRQCHYWNQPSSNYFLPKWICDGFLSPAVQILQQNRHLISCEQRLQSFLPFLGDSISSLIMLAKFITIFHAFTFGKSEAFCFRTWS